MVVIMVIMIIALTMTIKNGMNMYALGRDTHATQQFFFSFFLYGLINPQFDGG
jgi:hypothetical protein